MKFLIRLPRDGWYFSGYNGPAGKAEFGRIQNAKIYNSRQEALSEVKKMGNLGQRVVAITQFGCVRQNEKGPNSKKTLSGREAL